MEKSLRRLLEIKGLTQKDLAEQLYVSEVKAGRLMIMSYEFTSFMVLT